MASATALLPALLFGCGSELTDLIPVLPCVDSKAYPGGGPYKADVSDTSGMTLNGDAVSVAGVLRVTAATRNAVGSAYFSLPLVIDEQTNVLAHFSVRIGGGDLTSGADGMAFVLQSSPEGPNALGLDGGGLGYQNVRPSVAIELDPFTNIPDPEGSHVGLMLDGDINNGLVAHANTTSPLNDGVARQVWVDYSASAQSLEVYLSEQPSRPSVPLLSHTGLALFGSLGATVYVGFTASAGERFNDHEVLGEAWIGTSTLRACD